MSTICLHGFGGHGKVVADAALVGGSRVFVTDDAAPTREFLFDGVAQVERADAQRQLFDDPKSTWHVSIGANAARMRVFDRYALEFGMNRSASVIHPRASVSPHAQIGSGVFVASGAVVAPSAQLGAGVIVNHLAVVDHDCVVGAGAHIAPRASLGGGVVVGRSVLVGAGAVLLPGVRVADGCVIGAGAVLTSDALSAGVYVGVPARKIKDSHESTQ